MRVVSDSPVSTEPLCQVADAFRVLAGRSRPLLLEVGDLHPSLPGRPLDVVTLRSLLLHPSLDHTCRGLVWERLLELTGREGSVGEDWRLAVVGIAWPGLRAVVNGLRVRTDRALWWELAQAVLAGFWEALVRIREERAAGQGGDPGRIPSNLLWAARRAGLRLRAEQERTVALCRPLECAPDQAAPEPAGEDLLELAVERGVLDRAQAELVAASRIGRTPMRELAAEAGVTPEALGMRRVRAEKLLVRALRDGVLETSTGPWPSTGR